MTATPTAVTFQFHKGTIRTHEREAKYNKYANFNSIKVRLELDIVIHKFINDINFNSIKVRLEPIKDEKLRFSAFISIP